MPGKKRRIAVGGRYDERMIAARIDAFRRDRGLEIKDFCSRMGWGKWDYTRKIVQVQTPMDVYEYNLAAEILDMPIGAPFIDTLLAERLQRWLDDAAPPPRANHTREVKDADAKTTGASGKRSR